LLFCNCSLFFLVYSNYIFPTEHPSNIDNKKDPVSIKSYEQKFNDLNYSDPKASATLTSKNGYAIVIGISDYPGSTSDLSYCDDDAIGIYNLLIDDCNFQPQNVIYLQDSSATQNDINNAFDQISSKITENDIFFFYYSGHGGFGSEVGPLSQTINSPHPYPNNYDNMWSIYHTDAVYMRVHFSHFDLEYGYDDVYLGDTDLAAGWYYEGYSGYSTGFWSGWIPLLSDNRLYIRMTSDSSITEWGFEIDNYEAIIDDGTHFLCSYDSIPNNPSSYYIDSLLDSNLDNMDCEEKYIVLDSCNSGGLIPEVQEIGRYIMTACEADESSLESSGLQHGVFTNYFLDSLNSATDINGDGVKSMEECFSYTYSNTVSYSGSQGYTHHPQEYDGINGDCVLYPSLGNVSFTTFNNELSYSFTTYGNGLIEEIYVSALSTTLNLVYTEEDLTLNPASTTGFGEYSGTITLDGAVSIDGYGVYAKIRGNRVIRLNHTNAGDTDLDGLDDILEIMSGLNPSLEDSDSDGLDDYIEFFGDTDPLSSDTDGDCLLDGDEVLIYLTDPTNIDTEGDGMDDGFEVAYNLNPLIDDCKDDKDDDGLDNLKEYEEGSNPNNEDTDDDEMPDGWEYENKLNLLKDDADDDEDEDDLSNLKEYKYKTDPQNFDTDGDGYSDGVEVLWGTDPLNPYYSLNSIFLNFAGIALLCFIGYYFVRTSLIKIDNKVEDNKKFKLKGHFNNYNSLKIDTIKKPVITRALPSYKPRSPYKPAIPSRIPLNQPFPLDLPLHEIKNIILNKMPPPKSKFTPEGKKAMAIASNSTRYISEGKLKEAFESMILALTLGVPEPINNQIKTVLLDILQQDDNISNVGMKTSTLGPTERLPLTGLRCNSCGTLNESNDKFCGNCGLKLEKEMKLSPQSQIFCKSCGKINNSTNKFCIKCGLRFEGEKSSSDLKMSLPPGFKRCSKCGNLNESLNKFCIKCGRAF